MSTGELGERTRQRALALRAWRAFFEGSRLLETELERRMKADCGLDLGDFNVLLALSEADDGRLRMGDLAREIAFAPGRLTYRVESLERRGFVRRECACDDGRGTDAVLTDAGRAALRRARPLHARAVDELFLDGLGEASLAELERVFTPVRDRLRPAAPRTR